MSTGDHHEDSTEEMAAELPPLKWSRETFDGLIRNFSAERLVRNKAGKRKQADAGAEGQPTKKIQRKKITRRGNLDAFISEHVSGKRHLLLFSFHFLE
ncbi:hypothetical protein Hanom_Chr07g00674581 [Helianthus anomalus]